MLKEVYHIVKTRGWRIGNIDTVIVAERPKLKPHINLMRQNLAKALEIETEQVSVKATTNEQLGPTGREEGIASYAVVVLLQS